MWMTIDQFLSHYHISHFVVVSYQSFWKNAIVDVKIAQK